MCGKKTLLLKRGGAGERERGKDLTGGKETLKSEKGAGAGLKKGNLGTGGDEKAECQKETSKRERSRFQERKPQKSKDVKGERGKETRFHRRKLYGKGEKAAIGSRYIDPFI